MKLTKDEARILAAMVEECKYNFSEKLRDRAVLFQAFEKLEMKLWKAGKDERRSGRTSMNDFSDCLKRFAAFNGQPSTINQQ